MLPLSFELMLTTDIFTEILDHSRWLSDHNAALPLTVPQLCKHVATTLIERLPLLEDVPFTFVYDGYDDSCESSAFVLSEQCKIISAPYEESLLKLLNEVYLDYSLDTYTHSCDNEGSIGYTNFCFNPSGIVEVNPELGERAFKPPEEYDYGVIEISSRIVDREYPSQYKFDDIAKVLYLMLITTDSRITVTVGIDLSEYALSTYNQGYQQNATYTWGQIAEKVLIYLKRIDKFYEQFNLSNSVVNSRSEDSFEYVVQLTTVPLQAILTDIQVPLFNFGEQALLLLEHEY